MQSVDMPAENFLAAMLEEKRRADKMAKVHHQHLPNGDVRVRQFYTGNKVADVKAAMDADLEWLRQHGATNLHRTKIGRNSTCPCGSGRKFKKCCIGTAKFAS